MQPLSEILDKITHSEIWQSVFSHFTWLDWLAVIFVVVGIFYGMRKGFMPMLGEIIQLMIVLTITLEFYDRIIELIKTYVDILPEDTLKPASFVVTGLLTWLVCDFILKFLGKLLSAQTSAPLKLLGGAVGGAFYLWLFLSFISQAIILSSWDSIKTIYEKGNSYVGVPLAETAPRIHSLLTRPFKKSPSEKTVQTESIPVAAPAV